MEKFKVLWIDDESHRIEYLFKNLERNRFEFHKVRNEKEALQEMDNLDSYDLVILDIILPEGKDYTEQEIKNGAYKHRDYIGLDVLEVLKQRNQKKIPIIILTIVRETGIVRTLKKMAKDPQYSIYKIFTKGILENKEVAYCIYSALKIKAK